MGESRARSTFGSVELEVAEISGTGFGELDWDFAEAEATVPPVEVDDDSRTKLRRPGHAKISDPIAAMRELYAAGDTDGALAIAAQAEAEAHATLKAVPRILVGPAEIAELRIDHRAGFLLGVIDGMQTLEEILDVCAMPAAEALEVVKRLVDLGVIAIE